MENHTTRLVMVKLPQFSPVQNLILDYSSLMKLKNGVHFRVCNVCSKRLSPKLDCGHSEHLKTHLKHWNHYMVRLSKDLKDKLEREHLAVKDLENEGSEKEENEDNDSSSSTDSEEERNVYNVVDSLQHSIPGAPPLTTFEMAYNRKYTYDVNTVREFREFSDLRDLQMCVNLKRQQIHDLIGQGISRNLLSAHQFYNPNSETVNKIARLLCPKQCYYLPGECLFDDQHTSNFKDLMKKDLHDQCNPKFENLLTKDAQKCVKLEYNQYHHPQIVKLCNDVGFTTKLEYNSDGFLDLNYDLFCEELWYFETPLFRLEEKKVFDIILGLLMTASETFSVQRQKITVKYCQSEVGLNKPVLAVMQHGPDMRKVIEGKQKCDLKRDENISRWDWHVTHAKCKNFNGEDYWMYKHHVEDSSNPELSESKALSPDNVSIQKGPASLQDQSIVYPCNLGHWHECECESCSLLRMVYCMHHKKHMEFNLPNCQIQENIQCKDHRIDHPDNFKPGDIVITKNVIFHNGELLKNGRNYYTKKVILAGLKLKCNPCRNKTEDHFKNHHTVHAHCELCLYAIQMAEDVNFWNLVCNICGTKFETERLKNSILCINT